MKRAQPPGILWSVITVISTGPKERQGVSGSRENGSNFGESAFFDVSGRRLFPVGRIMDASRDVVAKSCDKC